MSGRGVVFLDRDGTVIVERNYLSDPARVSLIPGAAATMVRLRALGYRLVLLSNQSGVGRGWMTLEDVHRVNARMQELLQQDGAVFDALLFCPHSPDTGCECRKPGTGMIDAFERDTPFDRSRSWLIGDRLSDLTCARNAGLRGILVETDYAATDVANARRLGFAVATDITAAGAMIGR